MGRHMDLFWCFSRGLCCVYAASRPGYPAALFEMLGNVCAPVEGMTVADVGARTGLLTRGLLKYGYRVVAVEPNLGMRRMSVDAG
jgi:2-polyprenyl-3-methyl-5-hydroxy-6-metoxy-1,4-benzoquinol methylase